MKSSRLIFGILILACVAGAAQQAQFKTSAPERKKIMEELTYFYEVESYTPAVSVDLTKSYDASTPESAAMRMLQAMAGLDFDRWLSLWAPESQQMMRKKFEEKKQGAETFKPGWSKVFTGRSVALTKRIETGPYVIVVAAISGASSEQPYEMEFVLRQINGVWMGTQELAADPVLLSWKEPDTVIRRVVRMK